MSTLSFVLLLLVSLLSAITGFRQPPTRGVIRTSLSMKTTGDVVIVGLAGGVAENIAVRLAELSIPATTMLDAKPISPKLRELTTGGSAGGTEVYVGACDSPAAGSILRSKKVVVLCGDEGDAVLQATYGGASSSSPNELLQSHVSAAFAALSLTESGNKGGPTVIACASANTDSSNNNLPFLGKPKSVLRSALEEYRKSCQAANTPFHLLRYGKLVGGVAGLEPLPFLGLPLQEPELEPSYLLRSVVVADPESNKYASTELCTRASLAETIVRLMLKPNIVNNNNNNGIDGLVISVEGNPPTDKEWNQLLTRAAANSVGAVNAELLRVEFGSVAKPEALMNWIVDAWFPQALIDADAATVRSGARPVRAVRVKAPSSKYVVEIKWEDLKPDLTVQALGSLKVEVVTTENPYLVVTRQASGPLANEMPLLDKLLEGINKNVFKKGFCTPMQ